MTVTNTCMGIYQYTDEPKRIFTEIIYPLVETHTGLTCIDGLSHYESQSIKMDLINRLIEEARLVIVDISHKNVNVYLELGMAYSSKKSIIFLCKKVMYESEYAGVMPFDTRGKELLLFEDDNDLKIQLGKFISDCLFKTQFKTVPWLSTYAINQVKSSSQLEFYVPKETLTETPEFWTTMPVHKNFIIKFDVCINNLHDDRNPDLRFFLATKIEGYPRIGILIPWEHSEINPEMYECHIDLFKIKEPLEPGLRKQQVTVSKKETTFPLKFHVFVSFIYPNLVVESSLFKIVDRLIVSINEFHDLQYPTHFSQYLGFRCAHRVSISGISIKEVFI